MPFNADYPHIRGFVKQPDGSWSKVGAKAGRSGATTKLEPDSSHATLAQAQVEEEDSRQFLVRVTSFRKRLLDEDNLCEKYHVDVCRYAGAIPGDEPGKTKIEVGQKKVGKGQAEFVRVEVFEL